jgi:acetyl esterase/lipase
MEVVPLWKASAPMAAGNEAADIPSLKVYRAPEASATGAAFVICPGGGYAHLAPHEGEPIAQWMNTLGIHAFVLKYRLAPRYKHPVPMLDVQRAIRLVRSRATEWKIDPKRIGALGFSAGGHLASTAATHFDPGNPNAADAVDRESCRPDAAVLCYPVISMEEGVTHGGSRTNLLGPDPSRELATLMSNDRQVTAQTPPTFLFHTADDGPVPSENSLRFAMACARAKVPYELHIYAKGPHGVGLATADPVLKTWTGRCADWLRKLGFAREAP